MLESTAGGTMFISHHSGDVAYAMRIRRLLGVYGYERVFLDADPESGLSVGEYFASQLSDRHSEAEIYVFLISKAWLRSHWCQTEHRSAVVLKRPRIPVILDDLS